MDHAKYHAIRAASVKAYEDGNPMALAAIISGGDSVFNSIDWTVWSDDEKIVFGILTGVSLVHGGTDFRVVVRSKEFSLCAAILESEEAVMDIAKMIWPSRQETRG